MRRLHTCMAAIRRRDPTTQVKLWKKQLGAGKVLTARQFFKAHMKKGFCELIIFPMAMDSSTKLTVLISGNGTNLQAVIDKIDARQLPATIVRVISNRKNAYGLERAKRAGIPTLYHNLLKYKKSHPPTD